MSKRHQKAQGSIVPEPREQRKIEHRKVRHAAKQALHVATAEGVDPDSLIVPDPHATHGYRDEREAPVSHAIADPERRVRHWKQPFWKRRKLERKRRVEAMDSALRKA